MLHKNIITVNNEDKNIHVIKAMKTFEYLHYKKKGLVASTDHFELVKVSDF